MDQLSFFDDASPPVATRVHVPFYERDVVFFGIRLAELGPEVADIYRMLRRSHGLTGIPYQPSRLHVSLLRVGEHDGLNEDDLNGLRQVASKVSVRPFPIAFETVLSFDGNARPGEKRPIVLPVADGAAEVIGLARDIEVELRHRLPIEGGPPPSPHLTMLRDLARIAPTALNPPIGAHVTGFELILSRRREGRYETLWP